MKAEIELFCSQLLEAAANSVYQGVLLAIVVGLLLRLLVRTNAATRHAIWLATLGLVVLAIPAHLWLDRRPLPLSKGPVDQTQSIALRSAGPPPVQSTQAADDSFRIAWTELTNSASAQTILLSPVEPIPWPVRTLEEQPAARPELPRAWPVDRLHRTWRTQVFDRLKRAAQSLLEIATHPLSWKLDSSPGWACVVSLVLLWLAITVIGLMNLGRRVVQLRRLKLRTLPGGPELAALFARLRDELPGARRADLRISAEQRCPLVLGLGRPVILLPAELAAGADFEEAEHVLRHELAHVRRYDDWANLVQRLAQTVLFFHPAVWWIGKHLSLDREIACDDYALQHGKGRRNYALILAKVASRIQQPMPLLASGVSSSKSQLQQRIDMILNTRRNASPGLAKARLASVLSVTALLAVLTLCSGPRFGLAQTAEPPAAVIAANSVPVGGVVSAIAASGDRALGAPAAIVVAQSDGPNPPTPAVEPGPKFKSGSADQEPREPVEMAPAEMPDPPSPGPAPRVARLGRPGKAPQPPGDMDNNNDNNASIEDRLRRLEKMVHELMSQQNKHAHGYQSLKDGTDLNLNMNMDQQALDRLKESAERQAQRAAEQAERAAEQRKRASKEFDARLDQDQQNKGQFREALQKQLEALRKARESLGQEMEHLERQIQKLEKEQGRGEKEQQRRSENSGLKLQAQSEPGPDVAR